MATNHYGHLPQFLRAARLGNFSAVAREFGVSAVAVSKNMATLEAALGVRLFHRSTRAVTLTPEGRTYFERCEEPLRAIEEAGRVARQDALSPTGRVRITCVKPFGRGYVIPLLQRFARQYPQVHIEFALDDRVADMVQEGFDIGIRAGSLPGPEVIARDLCGLSFVVCASPEYLAQFGVPRSVADLAAHNCLRLGASVNQPSAATAKGSRADADFVWRVGTLAAPTRISVRGSFAANDFLALESAALSGLGLMHAPLPMVIPHFRSGALCPVLPEATFSGQRVHLHYRTRKNQPLRVKLLIDHLLVALRQHPDLLGEPETLCGPFWKALTGRPA